MSEPAADVLYHSAPVTAFRIDNSHCLLTSPDLDGFVPAVHAVPTILSICLTPRTLADHEAAILAKVGDHPDKVAFTRLLLKSLVKARLVVPTSRGGDSARHVVVARPRWTIGVLATNDAYALRRCLRSYAIEAAKSDQAVDIVVSDPHIGAVADANRRAALNVSHELRRPIEYMGTDERTYMSARLMGAGAPARATTAALRTNNCETTAKNALLLASVGKHLLWVDARTVSSTWSDGLSQRLRLAGHDDLRAYRFLETRSQALATNAWEGKLLAQHDLLLGRELGALVREWEYDASAACQHMGNLLRNPSVTSKIRVTMAGTAGDGDVECPYALLLRSDVDRTQMVRSREELERALTFGEIRRVASDYLVSHHASCEIYCTGMDCTELLPPFAPGEEGTADVFAALVSLCHLYSLFAHLPVGVWLDTGRTGPYAYDVMPSAVSVHMTELFALALVGASLSQYGLTAADRLQLIGKHVCAFAALPHQTWKHMLKTMLLERRSDTLRRLSDLTSTSACPTYIRAAMTRYRLAMLNAMESPNFMVPSALMSDDGLQTVQRTMLEWGAVLEEWPRLWSIAGACPLRNG